MYNIEYICMYVCIDIITTTATTAATEKELVAYLLYETLILSFTALLFYIKLIPC